MQCVKRKSKWDVNKVNQIQSLQSLRGRPYMTSRYKDKGYQRFCGDGTKVWVFKCVTVGEEAKNYL